MDRHATFTTSPKWVPATIYDRWFPTTKCLMEYTRVLNSRYTTEKLSYHSYQNKWMVNTMMWDNLILFFQPLWHPVLSQRQLETNIRRVNNWNVAIKRSSSFRKKAIPKWRICVKYKYAAWICFMRFIRSDLSHRSPLQTRITVVQYLCKRGNFYLSDSLYDPVQSDNDILNISGCCVSRGIQLVTCARPECFIG
jgi:hypothetical protein